MKKSVETSEDAHRQNDPPPFCQNMTFYKSPSLLTPKFTLPYLYKVSTDFSLFQISVVGANTQPPSLNQLGMGAFQRFWINIMLISW